jgi:hypothetical protein
MPTVGTAGVTATDALCVALPPGPVQVTVKVVLAVSGAVDAVPAEAFVPDHPPEATQLVAFWLAQVSAAAFPATTEVGLAFKATMGGSEATVTVVVCEALPPAPAQVSVYDAVDPSAAVDSEPLGPKVPLQPPDAEQVVALAAVQVNTAVPPAASVVGEAVRVTAGAGAVTTISADCEVSPPAPRQVRTYIAFDVSSVTG